MITIKWPSDCDAIVDQAVKRHLLDVTTSLREADGAYFIAHPEYADDMSYSVLIDNATDDITTCVLEPKEKGLLCEDKEGVLNDGKPTYGWCWESVKFHADCNLFEILIVMNNELAVAYYVPNDDSINQTIQEQLQNN
jgi:hypothetical protein